MEVISLIVSVLSLVATVVIAVLSIHINVKIDENNDFKSYMNSADTAQWGMIFSSKENSDVAMEKFYSHLDDLCEYVLNRKNKKFIKIVCNSFGDIINIVKEKKYSNVIIFCKKYVKKVN